MQVLLFVVIAICTLTGQAAQAQAWRVPLSREYLHPNQRIRAKLASWVLPVATDPSSHIFTPLQYGGDPTGMADSTAAVSSAIGAVLNASRGVYDADYIHDCGGATLDLAGGVYLISAPLVIPRGYGNLRVLQGTLRASQSFSPDRFLIEVGAGSQFNGNNVDVYFSSLFLDAAQVAAGALNATGLFGGVIGPQVYIFNFTKTGIEIMSGHEVTIQQTWVGEYWWSDPRKENSTASTAVGIRLDGNDHVVDDVVVFSSHIGILVNGGADLISNVHTWNLANAKGGVGILVNASQTRLTGCYLDWNDVVIATATRVTFTGGFFLCGGHIQLIAPVGGAADGIVLRDNQFIASYCHFTGYDAVEAVGNFSSVTDVTVSGTMAEQMVGVRSTQATLTVTATVATTLFVANFSQVLLFDTSAVPILSVIYSLSAIGESFPRHIARPVEGSIVTVETDIPVTGSVTISVDQSSRRGPV